MPVDLATFRATYPEFANATDALVLSKLTEAQSLVPAFVWNAGGDPARDLTQQATFLYCAQFLAESPYARHMALTGGGEDGKKPGAVYAARLAMLKRTVTGGFRVI